MLRGVSASRVGDCASVCHAVSSFWLPSKNLLNLRFTNPLSISGIGSANIKRIRKKANYSNRSRMSAFTTRALAQPLQNADELIDSVKTFIFDCDGILSSLALFSDSALLFLFKLNLQELFGKEIA